MQEERVLPRDGARGPCDHLVEQLRALLERAPEALLLRARPQQDRVALALELGVRPTHDLHDLVGERRHEARCHADPVALQDRPAHDPPQDVAARLVGRHDAVGDEERHRTRVVGEDPQRPLVGIHGRELPAQRHQRRERVGLEDRVDALLDDRHPLQAEARVDVVRRQRRERRLAVRVDAHVVLREDEVPVLQEALVLAARQIVLGAPLKPAVEVQLAARPARPRRPALPEVLRPRALHDPLERHADRLPRRDRLLVRADPELLVALEHRDPDVLGRKAEPLQRQLPGRLDGLLLEVVADREVAEHLEERQVARGVADVVDVRRAKALLHRRQAGVRRPLLAAKEWDERVHPRSRQQHRRVVGGRHERPRRQPQVVASLEEAQEGLSDLVGLHPAIVAHPTIASPERKTAVCPGAAPSNGSSRWISSPSRRQRSAGER